MANNYQNRKKYQSGPTVLEVVIGGIFKGLWFLITLPFKKRGAGRKGISSEDRTGIINRRQEIESLVLSENPIELKHAVMEADKLVDYVLQLKGYAGETFADRLRSAQKYIDQATYQAIWDGHKVRNQLAHESGDISPAELKRAVQNLLRYTK